jgi:hypothetical protein
MLFIPLVWIPYSTFPLDRLGALSLVEGQIPDAKYACFWNLKSGIWNYLSFPVPDHTLQDGTDDTSAAVLL